MVVRAHLDGRVDGLVAIVSQLDEDGRVAAAERVGPRALHVDLETVAQGQLRRRARRQRTEHGERSQEDAEQVRLHRVASSSSCTLARTAATTWRPETP